METVPRRHRRIATLALVCALVAPALPAKSRRSPAAPVTLTSTLDQIGRRAPTRSTGVSVAVAELDTGASVYARNPDQPETIASVTKMLSSAAAIHFLGPNYKFKTTFWRRGDVRDGSLQGSILVVGGGDPNISGRFYDNDSFAVFDRWADGLKRAGILRINGDLILNAGAFDRIYRHPDWPPDRDTRWYQAPISALSYNDNVVIVSVGRGALPGAPAIVSIDPDTDVVQAVPRARTVGKTGRVSVAVARPGGSDTVFVDGTLPARYFRYSVPLAIDDPPKFFGAALKSRLRKAGIELTGGVVEKDVQPDNAWSLVATTESDLMPTMAVSNKHSQSFYAEQIFKTLAYEKSGRGTWENALALERQFLAAIGLDPARYDVHDGSGLSASNRVAAADLVAFLRAMNVHPSGAAWRSTLAVSGDSEGSLRGRLLDSLTRGQVEAKTGTLNGVSTLAGYAKAVSGKTYVFAILLNGPGVTESRAHSYQDRLVRALIQKG
ncbi:MAG TPA: D-alanyl-D-alanine carboxypeptidase/D-alanyl-D-alanine-endopeptidase [Thermoanaerobaculia bacterium]|nr:D-alanyl-D-alanine carboxypeptidase/D-alanyl-D-alanine-endopeptidase [Thermoanaerobaculia bacterium]